MARNTEKDRVSSEIKCDSCEEIFDKFNDLEKYIKAMHDNPKTFHCHQCEKVFVSKLRLNKHMKVPTKECVKFCHCYNNDKEEESGYLKSIKKRKLDFRDFSLENN